MNFQNIVNYLNEEIDFIKSEGNCLIGVTDQNEKVTVEYRTGLANSITRIKECPIHIELFVYLNDVLATSSTSWNMEENSLFVEFWQKASAKAFEKQHKIQQELECMASYNFKEKVSMFTK